jgi:hypothetical protein
MYQVAILVVDNNSSTVVNSKVGVSAIPAMAMVFNKAMA